MEKEGWRLIELFIIWKKGWCQFMSGGYGTAVALLLGNVYATLVRSG